MLSRRAWLLGAGLLGLGMAAPTAARVAGRVPAPVPDLSLPENNVRALVRVMASLDEEDVPWWYDGTIYGVVGDEQPRPLLLFEGMELYYMYRLGDGQYELTGNTLTFFRDVETGKMIDSLVNPYTGTRVGIQPAVQGGGRGRGFNISVDGVRFTPAIEQIPPRPLLLDWTFCRDMVWLHNHTAYPPGMQAPRMQRQSMFVPLAEFSDPVVRRLPTTFSSTVFMPWLRWMEMGERPGHLVWHASGAKLRSLDDLPAEYRQRAERDHPEYLRTTRDEPA